MNPFRWPRCSRSLPRQGGDPAPNPRVTPEVLVVRSAAPAVVYIEVSRPEVVGIDRATGTPLAREQVISGSGVVIDKSGWIVTNNHVVASSLDQRLPQQIRVQFDPERDPATYVAELVSQVPSEDLALLKSRATRTSPS
jgi:S1-C subfamily serine protease